MLKNAAKIKFKLWTNKIEKLMEGKCFSYIIKNKSWKKVTLLSVIIFFCYYFSLKFIFPGYFDPLIPHHPDFFYTYNGFSSIPWTKVFMYPRPVGFFMLKVVGILGLKGVIMFLIFLSLLNILLTIIFIKKMGNLRIYPPVLIIYLFIIFSQPGFYFNYTYDFFDVVACFFAIAVMLVWLKIREKSNTIHLIFLSILIGLSLLSKEAYAVTLLIFWMWQFIFEKNKIRKNAASMIIITACIIIGVLIQSHISKSVWVNFASNTDNPYFISFNPRSMWKAFYFYIAGWVNTGALSVIILSSLTVFLSKQHLKEFFLFLFMGLSVYIPYSILPNHTYGYYFWLGVPLSYGAILLVSPHLIEPFSTKIKNKKIRTILSATFIVIFLISAIFSLKDSRDQIKDTFWATGLQLEQINRNVLSGFPTLKNNIKKNDKILITGMNFAAHPFSCQHDLMDIYFNKKNDFIDNYFGNNHNWTIFEHTKDTDKRCGSINYTNDNDLDLTSYDEIFIFGKDAKLIRMLTKDEIASLRDSGISRQAILNPYL